MNKDDPFLPRGTNHNSERVRATHRHADCAGGVNDTCKLAELGILGRTQLRFRSALPDRKQGPAIDSGAGNSYDPMGLVTIAEGDRRRSTAGQGQNSHDNKEDFHGLMLDGSDEGNRSGIPRNGALWCPSAG